MKKLIGLTGPSAFTQNCIDMLEEYYEADFVMLYHNDDSTLERWTKQCDGICLAGGVDIHPTIYDHSIWNNQGFSKFDLKRDIREIKIIEWCQKSGKPLLGICRGHQLIGVKYGFFLIPDLSSSMICHQPQRQQISLEQNEPMHSVSIMDPEEYFNVFPGRDPKERVSFSRVMGFDQNTKLWVNSFHHQGLAFPSKKGEMPKGTQDVTVYGTARVDLQTVKISKIIELMGGDTWVSCQWHPEFDYKMNTASRAVLERFKTLLYKDKSKVVSVPTKEGKRNVESGTDERPTDFV
jgi:gamma-glutamyl-gamma-aminobutyrate hydrolase PuuD